MIAMWNTYLRAQSFNTFIIEKRLQVNSKVHKQLNKINLPFFQCFRHQLKQFLALKSSNMRHNIIIPVVSRRPVTSYLRLLT